MRTTDLAISYSNHKNGLTMNKCILKTINTILSLSFLFFSGGLFAKDNNLLKDMVELEQAFIPVLFYTGKPVPPKVPLAMANYDKTWDSFHDEYKDYRASWWNWSQPLENVNSHVDMAADYVGQGKDFYLITHEEELEAVRTIIRDFRRKNGFPKFATDLLTDFHSVMGTMIGIVNSPDYSHQDISALEPLYKKASKAWSTVEKNPVDQTLWGMSDDKVMAYNMSVEAERLALDTLKKALASEDLSTIKAAVFSIKPPQVQSYLILGGVL